MTSPETKTVKAIKAEVYSRVVGYYRPVQDWNVGKQEEFGARHAQSKEDLAHGASLLK